MKSVVAILILFGSFKSAVADDLLDMDRDPASLILPTNSAKRTYPGGADEEDLKVQTSLPEAALRTDTRGIQKEVYKALYNQELKDESHAPLEE
jgi:hypothetical protein